MKQNKKFNTIIINWPNVLEWLIQLKYKYAENRNIGTNNKYIVTDGHSMQYFYTDNIHSIQSNSKFFVFNEFSEKYKIMTSYCTSTTSLYKCYMNKTDNKIIVIKTIIDKIPENCKKCKFNEVLEYCTQLSLNI